MRIGLRVEKGRGSKKKRAGKETGGRDTVRKEKYRPGRTENEGEFSQN